MKSRLSASLVSRLLGLCVCLILLPFVAVRAGVQSGAPEGTHETGGCPNGPACACGAHCACGSSCSCGMMAPTDPPYDGPIWQLTGSKGHPGITFASQNVKLLSWIPVTQFDPTFTAANTCEGYVSPSGREYAIIGLSGGTGFVEVTNPAAATIVGLIPDCGICLQSVWRDIKVYGTYAYSVSEEPTTGIQIIDMSNIDNGIVTLANTVSTDAGGRTHTNEINKASGFLYRCGGGSTTGLRIYSLTNPTTPTLVATTATGRYFHECQVVTYKSGPYAGKEIVFGFTDGNSGGGTPGVTILDVTNKSAIVTLTANYQYVGGSFSHQGWLSSDRHYLYLDDELDGNPATRIIDVSNLSAPLQVGSFSSGSTAIDHNLYTRGNLILESNYRSGIRIFDATNPTVPVHVGFFDTYEADDLSQYGGLWDNYPYLPSGIVLGSDMSKGLFVWCVGKPGDMNGDFSVNDVDVPLFVDALINGAVSTSLCTGADVNGDGFIDGQDIADFDLAYLGDS
jgi:choice-of-anchor B domain-containing protein